jgi:hypothetical protein
MPCHYCNLKRKSINPEYVEIIEKSQQKILKQLSFFDNNYLHPVLLPTLRKPMSKQQAD